jgi:hypothetical protein
MLTKKWGRRSEPTKGQFRTAVRGWDPPDERAVSDESPARSAVLTPPVFAVPGPSDPASDGSDPRRHKGAAPAITASEAARRLRAAPAKLGQVARRPCSLASATGAVSRNLCTEQ